MLKATTWNQTLSSASSDIAAQQAASNADLYYSAGQTNVVIFGRCGSHLCRNSCGVQESILHILGVAVVMLQP